LQLGDWVGREQRIAPEILDALGPGEFLSRLYLRMPQEPPVDFFLAYFPSQRTGDTIHSPKNCLPGAGWTPLEAGRITLDRLDRSPVTVNRYIIGQGLDRMLVLYWYQAHGRAVASDYWAKVCLLADAARLHRTDGALVRIITPIGHGEATASAQSRAEEFARHIFPLLNAYIPQ
jgi:EpsI family protein